MMQGNTLEVQVKEIEQQLRDYVGNRIFADVLDRSLADDIVQIIIRYISFNRAFGAGVAGLSSRLAVRRDLFSDKRETTIAKDRSMEVASDVFAAGIDEFGDTSFHRRHTHRMLAQATMKGLFSYGDYSRKKREELAKMLDNPEIDAAVLRGYGLKTSGTEKGLFHALGFHIGSEFLADQEFKMADKKLREKYPALVKYLENTKESVSGQKIPAYHWIAIHARVEEEHFRYAVSAANRALQYYVGLQNRRDVKKQILYGVSSFARLQEKFMKTLRQ